MKRFLLIALAGVALPVSALAADLGQPVYKSAPPPPPPAPVYNWTGCYGNAGAGYGMFNQDHQLLNTNFGETLSADQTVGGRGWLGLVGVGCDYQFSTGGWGNWVVGVFGDYDFMDLHGNFSEVFPDVAGTGSEKENWAWAVGGRVGYLVTPAILVYWNGGFTSTRFGGVNLIEVEGSASPFSLGSQTFDGGFIGGGTEIAVQAWPGLFWRSEYRYSSYRSENVQLFEDGVAFPGVFEHENKNVQTITTSLVYKFNWFGH
jgi:outer membrane immunogenic protein